MTNCLREICGTSVMVVSAVSFIAIVVTATVAVIKSIYREFIE